MKNQATDKWSYSQVETAICLWEAVLNFHWCTEGEEKTQLEEMFGNHGSFTMRAAIASLADDCDLAWEAREALTLGNYHIAFDFEFCPSFISGALKSGLIERALTSQYGGDTGAAANGPWTVAA
jgi:hypothetical protein